MAGTITFTGLSTDQSLNEVIDALLSTRRGARIEPLEDWKTTWETKLEAISSIDTALSSFYSTVRSMDRTNEFLVRTATSSNESILTASASSDALAGAHAVVVNQLAQAETEIHQGITNSILFHSGVADQTASINDSGDAATGVMGSAFTVTAKEGAPGNITLNLVNDPTTTYTAEVTDITAGPKATLEQGDYFTLSSPTADYYVWYDVDGTGSGDPAPSGYTGIKVDVSGDTTAQEVATSTAAAIDALDDFTVPVPGSATITVTNADGGYVTDASDSSGSPATGFTITTTTQGTDRVRVSYAAGVMTAGILDGTTTQREISDAIARHALIDTVVPGDAQSAWTLGGGGGADDTVTLTGGADGDTKTFKYTYDGTLREVSLSYHGTLGDLRDAINADPGNPGVTAKIVTSGGQDHLGLVESTPDATKGIVIDPDSDMTLDGSDGTVNLVADSFTQTVNASGADKVLQLQYGNNDAVDITVATGTTLQQLRDLINNADAGVRSWILDDGGTGSGSQHLVIAGEDTGEEYSIALNPSGGTTLDGANDTEDFTAGFFTETAAAQNAQIRMDGYPPSGWIERTTNYLTDVIDGVNITLADADPTKTIAVTVSTDKAAIMEKLETFKDAFNSVRTAIQQTTEFDPNTYQAGSLLGNYAVQIVKSRLDNLVSSSAPGFQDPDDPYINLQQLGFHTDTDDGSDTQGLLILDTAKLSTALDNDPDAVANVFSALLEGSTDDNQIAYSSALSTATPGIFDVEVNTDTEQGRFRTDGGTWSDWIDLEGGTGDYYLTGVSGPETGIALHITYANGTGTYTSQLSLKNGVFTELSNELEELFSASGPLSTLDKNYNDIIDNIEDKISQEERRLRMYEDRLKLRFARLDAYVSQMTQLGSFLSMLAAETTRQ